MYQHGKRTRRPRNITLFFVTVALISLTVIVSWLIVRKDIASTTAPKTTVPITTEIGADDQVLQKIDEALFSLDLPTDWKLQERRTESYANYYAWVSTKKGANDRRLTLHVNIMPPIYKLVRLQPLTVDGNKFILGNISDECINFAGGANRSVAVEGTAPFDAKWENIVFVCDPISANQTIGTATAVDGIAAKVGNNKFFFYYEDRNSKPDSSILRGIILSFRGK